MIGILLILNSKEDYELKKIGIIFDFDGTLVDSFSNRIEPHKKVAELITEFLKKRGIKANYHNILEKVIRTEEEGEKRVTRSRDEWWKQIFKELNINSVPEDFVTKLTNVY